jgi:hypothetical protein
MCSPIPFTQAEMPSEGCLNNDMIIVYRAYGCGVHRSRRLVGNHGIATTKYFCWTSTGASIIHGQTTKHARVKWICHQPERKHELSSMPTVRLSRPPNTQRSRSCISRGKPRRDCDCSNCRSHEAAQTTCKKNKGAARTVTRVRRGVLGRVGKRRTHHR